MHPRNLLLAFAFILSAASFGAFAQEASKPDRAETIRYINAVIGKSRGATLVMTSMMNAAVADHVLSYDAATKTYRIVLREYGSRTLEPGRGIAYAERILDRTAWTLRNLDRIEDTHAILSNDGQEGQSGEVRRLILHFSAASAREVHTLRIWGTSAQLPSSTRTLANGMSSYVSFLYRIGDPDDPRRLHNALLRLKELDAEVRDPFLD